MKEILVGKKDLKRQRKLIDKAISRLWEEGKNDEGDDLDALQFFLLEIQNMRVGETAVVKMVK